MRPRAWRTPGRWGCSGGVPAGGKCVFREKACFINKTDQGPKSGIPGVPLWKKSCVIFFLLHGGNTLAPNKHGGRQLLPKIDFFS